MKNKFSKFLRSFLPVRLVNLIRHYRRRRRLAKRFAINAGEDFLQKISIEGRLFSIYINPFLNGGVDDDIYTTGVWEPEITSLFEKYLSEGAVFLDIGANIGYHSLYAATVVGKQGKVVSFEPLPRLYNQMKKSVKENSFTNIVVHNVALSDEVGTGTLSLVDENVGASSLQFVSGQRSVSESVTVTLERLDSYSAEFDRLDMVKIDIEGSEYEALKGAESLLRQHKPVIVLEFSPQVYENSYVGKSSDLFHFIKNLGYTMCVIGNEGLDIETMLKNSNLVDLHANILCLPK